MSHTIQKKSKLLNRVRRIQGQIEGVVRALESEAGCSDVLQRIAAARGAMNGLMSEVLEEHIVTHILEPGSSKGADREAFADDLLGIVRAYLK